jgi:phosphate transport system ATP-binding protein
VTFGAKRALKDASLKVPQHTATAFIGATGCGKTTLLRAINRLHDLGDSARVTGSIKLDGAEILTTGRDVSELRRRIGMIFPRPAMMPGTVAENAVFALRAQGIRDRRELDEACERALRRALLWEYVGASDALDKPAGLLPTDLQQRLCIARVLAVEPEVLLFDDPTSGMDPSAAAGIEDIVARLRRDCTILLATNDLQQAARLSDVTCYMAGGEIVEAGDTPAVFSRPANARTEDFLSGRAS